MYTYFAKIHGVELSSPEINESIWMCDALSGKTLIEWENKRNISETSKQNTQYRTDYSFPRQRELERLDSRQVPNERDGRGHLTFSHLFPRSERWRWWQWDNKWTIILLFFASRVSSSSFLLSAGSRFSRGNRSWYIQSILRERADSLSRLHVYVHEQQHERHTYIYNYV